MTTRAALKVFRKHPNLNGDDHRLQFLVGDFDGFGGPLSVGLCICHHGSYYVPHACDLEETDSQKICSLVNVNYTQSFIEFTYSIQGCQVVQTFMHCGTFKDICGQKKQVIWQR